MKKLMIISSIVLGCSFQSNAQITESSYIVGGSSSLFLSTDPNNGELSRFSFSIRPEIGKFVSEKWLIGGGIGYSFSQNRNNTGFSNNNLVTNDFSGDFAATRFYPLGEKLYFTCEYGLGLGYSTFDYEYNSMLQPSVENRTTAVLAGIGVSPGLAYFINTKWMVFSRMGSLSYNYIHNIEAETSVHSFGYRLQGNSFGIGARYILGGK